MTISVLLAFALILSVGGVHSVRMWKAQGRRRGCNRGLGDFVRAYGGAV
ncbi:hypothetical protein ACV22V_03720 [Burkholderia sp. AW33-5]